MADFAVFCLPATERVFAFKFLFLKKNCLTNRISDDIICSGCAVSDARLNSHQEKKIVSLFLAVAAIFSVLAVLSSCSQKKTITIYASSEDFRIANAQKMFDEKFPEYKVVIQYKSTGELAAKLTGEGTNTDCDIVMELENTYLEKIGDTVAKLDGLPGVDFDKYLPSLVPESHRYVPFIRTSGAIVVNKKLLEEKGLSVPTCYDDLLKPEYKGLVSMPNPKFSGTGYIFYLNMVNTRGEEAALSYFDGLAGNLSGAGYTSSGSGPVKALKLGEAAIGLCMSWQAVDEINNGADYEILYFEEGAPYNTYSSAIVSGKENDEDIRKVFEYLLTEVTPKDKELYAPEQIYKDVTYTKENFPVKSGMRI